jgi:putative addiction module killer protein
MVRVTERARRCEGRRRTARLFLGSFANVKGVGAGVFERKIDFGPSYRIYFGREGDSLIVLLGGSTKQRQSEAIAAAISSWNDHRRRKP